MKNNDHHPICDQDAHDHGLSDHEIKIMKKIMGRTPNLLECGVFALMWSEHCSYKSSRYWLKKLPSKGKNVICGPGENAGIVDIGQNYAAVFKIESHNHPSFIEPYQGAATGVGGILRDIFTMGARPVASLNALRFGLPDHPKTRYLLSQVVAGIANYGNSMGIPTVGGETEFDDCYNGNILVNVMNVGVVRKDRIFYSAASGIGNSVLYVGAKTGRDGIHGASMASASFDERSEQKRPTVQVGDPFTEKKLLEACLEVMQDDQLSKHLVAIQDMGAAGLTSSSFEMADKGKVGIELWLDKVPMREDKMTPYELMLSESQERMLLIVKPESIPKIHAVFKKWQLDCVVIGQIVEGTNMRLMWHGQCCADIPVPALVSASPVYQRSFAKAPTRSIKKFTHLTQNHDPLKMFETLIGGHYASSRSWIWQQYDFIVRGQTVAEPGGDAAIIRIPENESKIALSCDSTPRYCLADPFEGAKQCVSEAWRNLTCVGSEPLAFTNNLNFANPEKPDIMGQIVGCIEGMAEAARKLNFPVVSGNVSLYNENEHSAIFPTPVIGGVGLLKKGANYMDASLKEPNHLLFLVGQTTGHMGASWALSEIYKQSSVAKSHLGLDAPPMCNLELEKQNGDFIRQIIAKKLVCACHDLSGGGLIIAIAKMALLGKIGATLKLDKWLKAEKIEAFEALFGEDQARYIIEVKPSDTDQLIKIARQKHIDLHMIGYTDKANLTIDKIFAISMDRVEALHLQYFETLMQN
ncbi:MAG: phosphoribosylformylglycinamidine synthase subunit PurL [Pseudomonadota bacterium]